MEKIKEKLPKKDKNKKLKLKLTSKQIEMPKQKVGQTTTHLFFGRRGGGGGGGGRDEIGSHSFSVATAEGKGQIPGGDLCMDWVTLHYSVNCLKPCKDQTPNK